MTAAVNRFYSQLPETVSAKTDVERLLLREYGSIFVARGAVPPPTIVFADQDEVLAFQNSVEIGKATLGGFDLELQAPAMDALLKAANEAATAGLSISPRGQDSARRDYNGTVELWASRVEPALDHWIEQGRLDSSEADRIRSLSPFQQVSEILRLESKELWFAKDLSKSIIYSVAPPGTSQHLAMLAFDVAEFFDVHVREILARHGWFRTVASDLPHFTYIGTTETELPDRGLKKETSGDQTFWVPDI